MERPGPAATSRKTTRLVDIVFPGATNHHGTLFGGAGLAHMDRVAFLAAARHAQADFVTASCERIDFLAPARLGEIIEATGRVVRVGRRSLGVEVELIAEAPLTGERRHCTRGVFNMVAVGTPAVLPPVPEPAADDGPFRMADLVLPEQTSHYGSLYGGSALAMLGKAAFVVATRQSRRAVVMASTRRVDFVHQIRPGDMAEVEAWVESTGRSSMTVAVRLWSEDLASGARHPCGSGEFVMVAVDERQRPVALAASGA
ncbi:acyl-CoA thioesterase [Ancylobacter sonchi]|uniref:acyl-CoA thioesterase n=1 Tax=Ancylobacter sonchi TaxID=1937790 RepID=UPI001BD50932|nr:hotdog domain-containing protein [Ancylobacter sonchi]MBS7535179.1 acyl-CoA thioesterase [Ancylobacter sonchi]